MKTLTGQRNQCPGCGEYFRSNYAFDMHRTGKHGVDRRCRTKEEMLAKGMGVNHFGYWVSELNTDLRRRIDERNEESKDGDAEHPDN